MQAKALFDDISIHCSRNVTKKYSTSFSLGILCLHKSLRDPIYCIYGFVRFADEIVDTFHDYDKEALLEEFKKDTHNAIKNGISLNPVLNSFQHVVRRFNITPDLINTFLDSMEMDLDRKKYDRQNYEEYILGSAEVVGLMCLKVFVDGDEKTYQKLKPYAMKLGAAFQKINFLRDMQADYKEMGRTYFPGIEMECFDDECKLNIEREIEADFQYGLEGVKMLPKSSRFGVYVAYAYFFGLLKKIQNTPANRIMKERIRIGNDRKIGILVSSYIKHNVGVI